MCLVFPNTTGIIAIVRSELLCSKDHSSPRCPPTRNKETSETPRRPLVERAFASELPKELTGLVGVPRTTGVTVLGPRFGTPEGPIPDHGSIPGHCSTPGHGLMPVTGPRIDNGLDTGPQLETPGRG